MPPPNVRLGGFSFSVRLSVIGLGAISRTLAVDGLGPAVHKRVLRGFDVRRRVPQFSRGAGKGTAEK